MGTNNVLILVLLVQSVFSQYGAKESTKQQMYDTTSDAEPPAFPYLEQEEYGKFNKDGIYMADGTFYFEDKFKEYQVTYMIRDMGYHFKKYAVKQKMGQETSTTGAGKIETQNTRFSGPLLGLGQYVLQSYRAALPGPSNEPSIGYPEVPVIPGPNTYSPGLLETVNPVNVYSGSGTYGDTSPPGVGYTDNTGYIQNYNKTTPHHDTASYSATAPGVHDPNIVAAMLG